MRRLIRCLDIMTASVLLATGYYLYEEFADLLSRTVLIGMLCGIGLLTLVHVEYSMIRAKRRIGNMIEPKPVNLPLDMGRQ